jgi:hypothetical protein
VSIELERSLRLKILTIIYDAAVNQSLQDLLGDLNITGWTLSFDYHGLGVAGQKVNTPVWPGTNNQMLIAGDDAILRQIAQQVRAMQEEFKLQPGIFMYLQDAEEL